MFLGLDLGTSGLRAVLVSEDQDVIGASEQPLETAHPKAGWSEQDPDTWLRAMHAAAAELKDAHPKSWAALRGIGISGHMHGATMLDADGAVLRPCILWNDTRAHAEAADLDAAAQVRALSGNIVFPGFTAPKLIWTATHEPDVFARVAKVVLPKDYLTYALTGRIVSEMSDAAGTSWLDTGARDWSDRLLEAGGMRRDQMPDLVEGSAPAGTLQGDIAARWGVSDAVVVVGGGGDNAAAACGVGAMREGDGFVSLGTSGVLLAARDSYAPKPESAVHTFCHAIPGTWYQMGVILAATDSLNWLLRLLNMQPSDLAGLLGDHIGDPGRIRFLPYLSGERTPHNDSTIRGAMVGLEIGAGPKDLIHAVMEGVGFALRDNLEALRSTGASLDRVLAIGGGARSDYWVQLLATILNLPVDLPAKGEFGAALGAARLAICGVTDADPADVMTKPEIARTVKPVAAQVEAYERAYQHYRRLYPAIKGAAEG